MSEVEKALSTWERFQKFSRRSLWKIACGVLVLGLIVAHGVYAKSQASSPMRYYSMLYDVFSTGVFFRFGNDVEVDFTRCSIADQPELQEEICERLTPIKEYTFHVNEEAPIQHYFSSVSVSVEDLSPGIYRINVTTMQIWTENGEKYSTGPAESYSYRYRYDSIKLRWEVIGHCG